MLNNFEYHSGAKIAYGVDRIQNIGQDVKSICGNCDVVLITDPGVVKAGLAEKVRAGLEKAQIKVHIFSEVKSDPTTASIDNAAGLIRRTKSGCVIGLGGGSAMDVAKTAALVALDKESAEYYAMCANPFKPKTIKTIMVPTTSGTGAEVAPTVVFTTVDQHKVWGWDPGMIPEMAILDPTLTIGLPPHLTAATGLDALVHAIEACTGKDSNPMVEAVGLHAIRLVSSNLEKVIQEPENLEARGNLMVGAMMAGLAIAGGGTGIAHSLGHALGVVGHIHHGRAVAICLNTVYKWNVEADVDIHAQIARALGVEGTMVSQKDLALAGADEFARLIKATGLKTSLEEDGLTIDSLDLLLEHIFSAENEPMRKNNCRLASNQDLVNFIKSILM